MVTSTSILTHETRLILELATLIGLSVLILSACLLFLGLVWVAVLGVGIFLAHTSSIQLLLMLIVGYEMYRVGQTVKRRRYGL